MLSVLNITNYSCCLLFPFLTPLISLCLPPCAMVKWLVRSSWEQRVRWGFRSTWGCSLPWGKTDQGKKEGEGEGRGEIGRGVQGVILCLLESWDLNTSPLDHACVFNSLASPSSPSSPSSLIFFCLFLSSDPLHRFQSMARLKQLKGRIPILAELGELSPLW